MDDTIRISEETILLKRGIERLNAGDTSVRGELLNIACQRLLRLTNRLRRDFDELIDESEDGRSAEEVFQNASLRLYQTLHDIPIRDVRHFYRLAATEIRRELIELCRYCQRFEDVGGEAAEPEVARHDTDKITVQELRNWVQFHDSVESLPEQQREVFELMWYHEMLRGEAAELLGVSLRDVRRLWRSARLNLHELLGGDGFSPVSTGNE